jgi:hypothetical protein
MNTRFTLWLPRVDKMGDVYGDAAKAAIEAQHEHLTREWRRIIVDAIRPEVGSSAERCADLIIAALSERITVYPPVSTRHEGGRFQ